MYKASEIAEIYNRCIDMVYRICYIHTKNKYDAEDMTQNVFIRLMKRGDKFENAEHEKAWLIRAAINQCRDLFKSRWYKVMIMSDDSVKEFSDASGSSMIDETLEEVLNLPEKYKTVLYLYYYEGYKTGEIAKITRKAEGTIRSRLVRGRTLLKERLEHGERD